MKLFQTVVIFLALTFTHIAPLSAQEDAVKENNAGLNLLLYNKKRNDTRILHENEIVKAQLKRRIYSTEQRHKIKSIHGNFLISSDTVLIINNTYLSINNIKELKVPLSPSLRKTKRTNGYIFSAIGVVMIGNGILLAGSDDSVDTQNNGAGIIILGIIPSVIGISKMLRKCEKYKVKKGWVVSIE